MDSTKSLKKLWLNSLFFLDNEIINAIIVIILVLYSTAIFENINIFIGSTYNYSIVRIIVLLLIIYITPKDPTIGILLALSYLISLNYSSLKKSMNSKIESFFPLSNVNDQVNNSHKEMSNQPSHDSRPVHNNVVNNSNLSKEQCLDNYNPRFEEVSDVCTPVSTFKEELNAQGLNFPEGFRYPNMGSHYEIKE